MNAIREFIRRRDESYSGDLRDGSASCAISLFRRASRDVPAYHDFLAKQGFRPTDADQITSLAQVPVTNKKNYIEQYPLSERCWHGTVESAHAISASSGSSGIPLFWPRTLDQELDGAVVHERILDGIFNVRAVRSTLFVNTFSLGSWIAGMFTQHCMLLTKLRNIPVCLANPGYSVGDALTVLRTFSPLFGQTIVAGHPPFLRMLLVAAVDAKCPVTTWNLRFLGAGEGISETFRDLILDMSGSSDPHRTFVNIYGSADAGLMGFETPPSIRYKRALARREAGERPRFVYQFDPMLKYLESVHGSIVISANAAMPLVRYDILDEGEVFWPQQSAEEELWAEPCSNQLSLDIAFRHLPVIVVRGRKDVAVSLFAVNIYPDNFKRALEEQSLRAAVTGRFRARKIQFDDGRDSLFLDVELLPNVQPAADLSEQIQRVVIKVLRSVNSEYNRAYETLSEILAPTINLVTYEDPEIFAQGKTHKLT